MPKLRRVALFTDSYYEANGVARTFSALEAYAARRNLPLLVVHGGRSTQIVETGSVVRLELRRSNWTSFLLEHDLWFDVALWRHFGRVRRVLKAFRPDVLHFTGPSDVGQLGAYLGGQLGTPMVGSWHTNLHEYASRRLLRQLGRLHERTRTRLLDWVEHVTLAITLRFYKIPRVVLAPNEEWRTLLARRIGKPVLVMTRGVDTNVFHPGRRTRTDGVVNIGYVGRLSAEKNVRALARVERALLQAGLTDFRLTIVGDGNDREWLRANMTRASLMGVLRGDRLAAAYADMDLFVFPSETETVGNVVLEAMASGVPAIAMAQGGPKFVVGSEGALLARDEAELVNLTTTLVQDADRRRTMGTAARRSATARSWDAVFDGVYRAYDLAIAHGLDSDGVRDQTLVAVANKQSA
jgi:glycosyltransferase involved in cell wall biosynthesis